MSHQQRTCGVPQSTTDMNIQIYNTEVINQISQIPPQTTWRTLFFNGTNFTILSSNRTDLLLLMPAVYSALSLFFFLIYFYYRRVNFFFNLPIYFLFSSYIFLRLLFTFFKFCSLSSTIMYQMFWYLLCSIFCCVNDIFFLKKKTSH
jgi:hypothetical protein